MFDLERYFQTAVFHDDTERHKPDPAPLVLAAERAGRSPGEVIYVGDSTHDIVAGRAAGMKTVAVLWGPFSRHVLEAERPDSDHRTPRATPAAGESPKPLTQLARAACRSAACARSLSARSPEPVPCSPFTP